MNMKKPLMAIALSFLLPILAVASIFSVPPTGGEGSREDVFFLGAAIHPGDHFATLDRQGEIVSTWSRIDGGPNPTFFTPEAVEIWRRRGGRITSGNAHADVPAHGRAVALHLFLRVLII
jgi:hypothetical protein